MRSSADSAHVRAPSTMNGSETASGSTVLIQHAAPKAIGAGAVIAIDNGSACIKAGIAGEEVPRTVVPTVCTYSGELCSVGLAAIAAANALTTRAQQQQQQHHQRRQRHKGGHKMHFPLDPRKETDFEALEDVWEFIFSQELRIDAGEHPVVMTEVPAMTARARERMAEVLFESFRVPALNISSPAVLSLFAQGMATGVAVDCGNRIQLVPVVDGVVLESVESKDRNATAGLTEYLARQLTGRGVAMAQNARDLEVVRRLKEQACFVAADYEAELAKPEVLTEFQLGPMTGAGAAAAATTTKKVMLGRERFQVPESLFKPELLGMDIPGIHVRLHDVIRRSPMDVRRRLYSSVVVSGGTTLFAGFPERLEEELFGLATTDVATGLHRHEFHVIAPRNRKFLAWTGASLLGSVPQFVEHQCLSIEAYNECGTYSSPFVTRH